MLTIDYVETLRRNHLQDSSLSVASHEFLWKCEVINYQVSSVLNSRHVILYWKLYLQMWSEIWRLSQEFMRSRRYIGKHADNKIRIIIHQIHFRIRISCYSYVFSCHSSLFMLQHFVQIPFYISRFSLTQFFACSLLRNTHSIFKTIISW